MQGDLAACTAIIAFTAASGTPDISINTSLRV
jgi:hypothetical protein